MANTKSARTSSACSTRHSDKDMPHLIRIVSNTPPPAELSPYDKLALFGLVVVVVLYVLGRLGNKKD